MRPLRNPGEDLTGDEASSGPREETQRLVMSVTGPREETHRLIMSVTGPRRGFIASLCQYYPVQQEYTYSRYYPGTAGVHLQQEGYASRVQ